MQYRRILAVGDIHGMYKKLIALMDMVRFNPAEDLLVFLGDYIDRGPQSLGCLDYVMDLQQRYPERVVCLKGNHESMCSNYYCFDGLKCINPDEVTDMQAGFLWERKSNGGKDTMRQFAKLTDDELQKRLRWMRKLPASYRIGNFFFCHAGVYPHYSIIDTQSEKELLWIRDEFFCWYRGEETVVVGHTPVQMVPFPPFGSSEPKFLENHIIMCDTGACLDGGRLSCVDVLSRNYWQT